jgi:hypothetical protein
LNLIYFFGTVHKMIYLLNNERLYILGLSGASKALSLFIVTYSFVSVHIFRVKVEKTRGIIRLVNNVSVVLVLLIGGVLNNAYCSGWCKL